ncbi:hypothetical protein F5B20DRAFT_577499 [Whalleya microplaca]|nr:hypothetical protein F5B20DRAFT_577499 [Whalleya microplaca]
MDTTMPDSGMATSGQAPNNTMTADIDQINSPSAGNLPSDTVTNTFPDSTPATFKRFPSLPTEIRLMIWELALTQPRVVCLDPAHFHHESSEPTSLILKLKGFSYAHIPILFLVNHEARALAVKRYTIKFSLRYTPNDGTYHFRHYYRVAKDDIVNFPYEYLDEVDIFDASEDIANICNVLLLKENTPPLRLCRFHRFEQMCCPGKDPKLRQALVDKANQIPRPLAFLAALNNDSHTCEAIQVLKDRMLVVYIIIVPEDDTRGNVALKQINYISPFYVTAGTT